MDLLKQCQIWNDNNEYQKIIDAIEAVPAEERTPEMDSELARAYNNIADPDDRELYLKAISLLKPHEEYFKGDHYWNFRMAYAYYYLDQEGRALHYFKKALEARPGDRDTEELIQSCRDILCLPKFRKNFRQRTAESWNAFERGEEELRRIMDEDKNNERGEELIAKCSEILHLAFEDIAFEMGFNGQKYEIILTPEGNKIKLFELIYFLRHAPAAVSEHWNIIVGRQPTQNLILRSGEWEVSGDDVQVWTEKQDEQSIGLTVYCEKLLPLLKNEEGRVWWMLSTLTDQTIGEIPNMRYIDTFDVVDTPKEEPSVSLSKLPEALESMGFTLYLDPQEYLDHYVGYQLKPDEDPDADWRMDVIAGSTCCPPLINQYMSADDDGMDILHADGIVAGFLCYPLDGFDGEDRSQKIFDFRDKLEETLMEQAGDDALTLIGGATGIYTGYVDFIAWDLHAVLNAAAEFFQESDLSWASFHVFRREVGTIRLVDKTEDENDSGPAVHEDTGSLLSQKDIDTMDSFTDEVSGYYLRMLDYLHTFIKKGVDNNKFTEEDARQDLQIALWYSFACNNMDKYEYYYRAAQWMPDSEQNAKGCGTWYYRYSVALTYCGRLEEAHKYAELGAKEEPDYPWIWLQVGKLRSHFGDKDGALEAAEHGLMLEPGDYEFLTLQNEIKAGATLEQMEYHWINPDADRKLQEGIDTDADEKQLSISCITTSEAGLEYFNQLFRPDPSDYTKNDPYCRFHYHISGQEIELIFLMNEAGVSKLKPDWLRTQKEQLDSGAWMTAPNGEGNLTAVRFGLDYEVTLIYKHNEDEEGYFQVLLDEDGTPVKITSDENTEEKDGEQEQITVEYYSMEEMEAVEQHIEKYFGKFESVWHELVSLDIHLDICLIPPTEERNYYTLVTMGMGAHRMNVPEELKELKLERAELAISLPPDWQLLQENLQDEEWYWPIRLLKSLARLPINSDTWLGWGHTLDNQGPFADNTELCAAMLTNPAQVPEGGEICTLPDGDEVNFYQIIPLHRSELEYKLDHSAEDLLEKMGSAADFIVHADRPDLMAVDVDDFDAEDFEDLVMDDGSYHLETIQEKNLPVEKNASVSHMAIYLRWCMEHDLMSDWFREKYGDMVQRVKSEPSATDLRSFIWEELEGILLRTYFNDKGRAFSRYYYGENDAPYYPSDIDNYAIAYIGLERNYSDEIQDEAYLFVPFDEEYYQTMAKVIDKRFVNWEGQDFNEETLEPSDLAKAMMEYLECECTYFPSMKDDDPIMSAYSYAKRDSEHEGFVPVLIKADDETLWECLVMNSDPEHDADCYEFDPNTVTEYRKKMLASPIKDGKTVLEELTGQRKEEAEDDDMDWDEEVLGEMEGGYDNDRFSCYWNSDTGMTYPLILAKIPVKNPWEIFAYLPFGNWNDCPDMPELMAVAKYWFEKYGAVPAAMTHDELEFSLPAPVPTEKAMEAAVEQYGFCPDVLDQGPEDATVGALADVLRQSKVWYFWWD